VTHIEQKQAVEEKW